MIKEDEKAISIDEEYSGLVETLYLMSVPGLAESILESAKSPRDEWIEASEINWDNV